jgi:hypothetical protein
MATDKRSGKPTALQLGLWPGFDGPLGPPPAPPKARGVGGRQGLTRPPAGGGGYLNGCTPTKLRADPRLREFAEIGLQEHWLQVAEIVGYDSFVALWRLLSTKLNLINDGKQIELTLRQYQSFERYQRNRYIETLAMTGMSIGQIHSTITKELGDARSYRQVLRLVRAARHRASNAETGADSPQCQGQPADTVQP